MNAALVLGADPAQRITRPFCIDTALEQTGPERASAIRMLMAALTADVARQIVALHTLGWGREAAICDVHAWWRQALDDALCDGILPALVLIGEAGQ